jgi:hypothetical protein
MKMSDLHSSPEAHGLIATALAFLLKWSPPFIGAFIMILVDMPKSKREYFIRFVCAFACSFLAAEFLFDFLDSTSMFAFLDASKRSHWTAIEGFCGAVGYFVVGAGAQWLAKFRATPVDAVNDLKVLK